MAFKVWIDDESITSTNLLTESDFASNTDRRTGFKSGNAASAKNVNSAIRQANLIAVALMQSMGITNLSLTSSVNDVKSAIDSYFTNAFNAKLGTSGDGSNVKVNFTQGSTGSLTSGRSLANLFGTLAAWCASFGELAKKSTVESKDIKDGAITSNKILDGQITTEKFASTAKSPRSSLSNAWTDVTISGNTANMLSYGNKFLVHLEYTEYTSRTKRAWQGIVDLTGVTDATVEQLINIEYHEGSFQWAYYVKNNASSIWLSRRGDNTSGSTNELQMTIDSIKVKVLA